MSSKVQALVEIDEDPIMFDSIAYARGTADCEPALLDALTSNVQESFDEIDILRGTVQYWESRRAAADPRERNLLLEAFRVMHGELLGLTARMKQLLDRAEAGLA
jgi:hypothetical protein